MKRGKAEICATMSLYMTRTKTREKITTIQAMKQRSILCTSSTSILTSLVLVRRGRMDLMDTKVRLLR